MFAKAETLPVVIEKEDGNVTVRQTWDGNKMVSVSEAKVVEGLVPADFKDFWERWDEVAKEANDTLVSVQLCEKTEGLKVIRYEAHCPWPIWNRVLISTFYLNFDLEDGTQCCVFSDIGNEAIKEKYFTAEDKKKFVLAV